MQQYLLKQVIDLSREKMHLGEGGPFAALVVFGDEVIGHGWNRVTSANDPTAHAEIEAIRQACQSLGHYSLRGCVIYSSCEPCPMCLAACYWARLDHVYFAASRADAAGAGFDDHAIAEQLFMSPTERLLPMQQGMREQACRVFEEWLSKCDRIPY